MRYSTNYDVGARKRSRPAGINEDSVGVAVFEQGHREGVDGENRPLGGPLPGGEAGDGDAESTDGRDANGRSDRETGRPTAPRNRSVAAFALADGAGGHEAGDAASYLAVSAALEELSPVAARAARGEPAAFDLPDGVDGPAPPDPDLLREEIEAAVVAAHRRVIAYAEAQDTPAYTTLVAGVVADGRVHHGWVGDSRAYLINRGTGSVDRLTEDHAVVAELAEAGEIDSVESHVHPRGNEITRAVGGSGGDPETATLPVETGVAPLFAEDVLVVTSDGLIDAQTDAADLYRRYVSGDGDDEVADEIRRKVVTNREIRELVSSASDLDEIAGRAVSLANDRGGKDNVSVIALADPGLPTTPDEGPPPRSVAVDPPVEDRETVVVPDDRDP